jgi:hypothetical protein
VIVMYCKISHVIRARLLPIGLGQRLDLTFCSLVLCQGGSELWDPNIFESM